MATAQAGVPLWMLDEGLALRGLTLPAFVEDGNRSLGGVLATGGHLPFPFGRELTGYEVGNLTAALDRAKAAGAAVLVQPFTSQERSAALVQFPGGYIAEIHAPATR